ncbi:MAG TPA: hypothetical protein VMG80_03915 [Solirubrobacteraceae bacterium]|nr:hypothetical protein [Solirubrobacteraceae bacterium]
MSGATETHTTHAGFDAIPESVLENMAADVCSEARAYTLGLMDDTECHGCAAVIDYDELVEAERDEYFIALLREAEEEGERAKRVRRRRRRLRWWRRLRRRDRW